VVSVAINCTRRRREIVDEVANRVDQRVGPTNPKHPRFCPVFENCYHCKRSRKEFVLDFRTDELGTEDFAV